MQHVIDYLGGPAAVARITKCKSPSVIEWRRRSIIPATRCPALEEASKGVYTCEVLSNAVRWHRVPDPDWPWHPEGRPLIDVTRKAPAATEQQEVRHAA